MNKLAGLLYVKGDYDGAEQLYQRALAICEVAQGPNYPDTATTLNNLALLLQDKGDYSGAEHLYRRAADDSRNDSRREPSPNKCDFE